MLQECRVATLGFQNETAFQLYDQQPKQFRFVLSLSSVRLHKPDIPKLIDMIFEKMKDVK